MNNDEPEIHPLDRDYSDDAPAPSRARFVAPIGYHAKLRRVGVIVFGLGFVALFPAAAFLGQARGDLAAESFASVLHQLAMVVILIGGVLVVTAYRWPQLSRIMNRTPTAIHPLGRRPYLTLVIYNVVAFLLVVGLSTLLHWSRSYELHYVLITGLLTTWLGLLVTMTVWHRGFLQGYAIGALAALIANGFSMVSMISNGFWSQNSVGIVYGQFAVILIAGLVSAGYVCIVESFRSRLTATESSDSHEPQQAD